MKYIIVSNRLKPQAICYSLTDPDKHFSINAYIAHINQYKARPASKIHYYTVHEKWANFLIPALPLPQSSKSGTVFQKFIQVFRTMQKQSAA